MENKYPKYWKNDTDQGGKKLILKMCFLKRSKSIDLGLDNFSHEYIKITNLKSGKKLSDNFKVKAKNNLTVVVL